LTNSAILIDSRRDFFSPGINCPEPHSHFTAADARGERGVGRAQLASTLNQGAFNLSNAAGAFAGDLALTDGLSYGNIRTCQNMLSRQNGASCANATRKRPDLNSTSGTSALATFQL
jgi:hypothetical protein